MAIERRFFELREADGVLSGVVMRYGAIARLPWGSERFSPGAFGDVGALDVVLRWQHDRGRPLARTGRGGGLTLTDTRESLTMRAEPPDTRDARDALTLVRAGVLRGLSVEFEATREAMEAAVRVVHRAILSGIGVVDRPAYDASTVAARHAARRLGLWL